MVVMKLEKFQFGKRHLMTTDMFRKSVVLATMMLTASVNVIVGAMTAKDPRTIIPGGVDAEVFGAGSVSTGANEFAEAFTPDGSTLYFTRSSPDRDGPFVILEFHRTITGWGRPEIPS